VADPAKARRRTVETAAKIPLPFKVFRRLIGLSSRASRFPPIKNPVGIPIEKGLLTTGKRDLSGDSNEAVFRPDHRPRGKIRNALRLLLGFHPRVLNRIEASV